MFQYVEVDGITWEMDTNFKHQTLTVAARAGPALIYTELHALTTSNLHAIVFRLLKESLTFSFDHL